MFIRRILFFLSLLMIFVNFSYAVVNIDSCQTLDIEGETYILNQSINASGDCLIIDAMNLTVDLGGFSITGDDGANDDGILFNTGAGDRNITIKNGVIKDFYRGINLCRY